MTRFIWIRASLVHSFILFSCFLLQPVTFSHALSRDFPDTFPGKELFVRAVDEIDPFGLAEDLVMKYQRNNPSNRQELAISAEDIADEELGLDDVIEIILQVLEGLNVMYW